LRETIDRVRAARKRVEATALVEAFALSRRPNHRAAGIAAVVVTISNQSPALVLALDVALARLPLGVEGVEVLFATSGDAP
jgi:hypothetical protein